MRRCIKETEEFCMDFDMLILQKVNKLQNYAAIILVNEIKCVILQPILIFCFVFVKY